MICNPGVDCLSSLFLVRPLSNAQLLFERAVKTPFDLLAIASGCAGFQAQIDID